jgi:hypothetical protein
MALTRKLIAKSLGGAAGLGSLASAGIHQGFGGPEVADTLKAAEGAVPALFLAQIEAAWVGATAAFVWLGVGLSMAALSRPGWLFSLGRVGALYFAAIAAAFVWSGDRWGLPAPAPQIWLLGLLAVLSAGAAWLAAPRRP